jgi:serine/threonine protein kinase
MGDKVAAGDLLAGKYRVERLLGSGGMGVVVAARHVQLDVLVALKFMSEEAAADPDLVARFLREARAAARLTSEHVARVTDVGTLESGAPYLVMEYLDGSDLSAVLSSEGRQPISLAAEYIVQACEALDEAHGAGIVHRDIKPSNLFLTKRRNGTPCIKVLDFGISKADRLGSSAKMQATHSHAILGSPLYMAPEQMRAARNVDLRADIWSLGATLYELLTGHVPFQADSLVGLALQVVQGRPRRLRESCPQVPASLEKIVLQCLEKERERRFSSARRLASALAPFALHRTGTRRWGEDSAVESSDDAITRIVEPPTTAESIAAFDRLPQPLPSAPVQYVGGPTQQAAGEPSPKTAGTTLPMSPAQGSVSPVAQSAPAGWRTGARLSWGRSSKFLRTRARAVWAIAAMGLLAMCGAAAAFALRWSPLPKTLREVTPVSAAMSPSSPAETPSNVPLHAPAATSSSPQPMPARSAIHIPTLSLSDLPSVPRPAFALPTPRSPSSASAIAAPIARPQMSAATRAPSPATSPNRAPDPLANPN